MNTTTSTPSHLKTYLDLEPDLMRALHAMRILLGRLVDQLGVVPQLELTAAEADGTIYIAGMALTHLEDALKPLPEAA